MSLELPNGETFESAEVLFFHPECPGLLPFPLDLSFELLSPRFARDSPPVRVVVDVFGAQDKQRASCSGKILPSKQIFALTKQFGSQQTVRKFIAEWVGEGGYASGTTMWRSETGSSAHAPALSSATMSRLKRRTHLAKADPHLTWIPTGFPRRSLPRVSLTQLRKLFDEVEVWADRGLSGPLVDLRAGVIMGWSARAGCTMAHHMFFRNMGVLDLAGTVQKDLEGLHPDLDVNTKATVVLMDPHYVRRHVLPTKAIVPLDKGLDFFKFKLVRNPFHRAVSAYLLCAESEYWEGPSVSACEGANLSFSQWLDKLMELSQQLVGGLASADMHVAPQIDQFELRDPSFYHLTCRIEDDVAACLRIVNNITGQDYQDRRGEGLWVKDKCRVGNVATWPYDRVKTACPVGKGEGSERPMPSTDDFYTPRERTLVALLYSQDFVMYGYDPAQHKEKKSLSPKHLNGFEIIPAD